MELEAEMIMLGISGSTELLTIIRIIMFLFGADNVSQVAGSLGKGISEFRKANDEVGMSELQEV